MIPSVEPFGEPARATPEPAPAPHGVRLFLERLFPESPAPPARTPGNRLLIVTVHVLAVVAGTAILLLRVPGQPWATIYGEDYWEWGVQSIQQPWHLFITYNGYWMFLPRLITQLALYLPLGDLAKADAVTGALVGSLCGLIAYHASAGHVRSTPLRALIGVSFVLLAIAPMEIADSAVNTVWYLNPALFWAVLWRPRTRGGMAVAGVLGFAAAASNVMVALFAPILIGRWYLLRRPREHAVTVGWLLGCCAQVPFVVSGYLNHSSRLSGQPAPLSLSVAFYGHDVLLPAVGWHWALWLTSQVGRNGGTAIMGIALAVVFGVILVKQPPTRPFVVTALLTGFVLTVFGITLTGHLATAPVLADSEGGARYTVLPILLMEGAVIVALDYALRNRAPRARHGAAGRPTLRPAIAVAAVLAVLAAGWIWDFRYPGIRSEKSWAWAPIVATWENACAHSRTGYITEQTAATVNTLPCANIHR